MIFIGISYWGRYKLFLDLLTANWKEHIVVINLYLYMFLKSNICAQYNQCAVESEKFLRAYNNIF